MSLSAEEQQKRREKFAQDRKEIMQEYIYFTLGPLLDEQDILAVWLEYDGLDKQQYLSAQAQALQVEGKGNQS